VSLLLVVVVVFFFFWYRRNLQRSILAGCCALWRICPILPFLPPGPPTNSSPSRASTPGTDQTNGYTDKQTEHFQPLWARNVPKFGIAHALALGLGPWLAAEVPSLVDAGMLPASGR
jgi:hypothetical protein